MNVVYALTGRAEGFRSQELNTAAPIHEKNRDDRVSVLRKLLRFGEDDYHTLAALAALRCTPAISWETHAYLPIIVTPRPDMRIEGGTAKGFTKPVGMEHLPKFPIATEWVVTMEAGGVARIKSNVGREYVTTFTRNDDSVYVVWPEDLGFSFSVVMDADNTSGSFKVIGWPITYPYTSVVDEISNSREAVDLMQVTGFLSVFSTATNPIDKLAAVCMAIIKTTTKIN